MKPMPNEQGGGEQNKYQSREKMRPYVVSGLELNYKSLPKPSKRLKEKSNWSALCLI